MEARTCVEAVRNHADGQGTTLCSEQDKHLCAAQCSRELTTCNWVGYGKRYACVTDGGDAPQNVYHTMRSSKRAWNVG